MSFSAPRGGMGGAPAAASAAQAAGPTTQPPAPPPPAQAPPARPSNVNTPPPRRAAQTQRRPGRLPRLHKDTGYFSDVEPVGEKGRESAEFGTGIAGREPREGGARDGQSPATRALSDRPGPHVMA